MSAWNPRNLCGLLVGLQLLGLSGLGAQARPDLIGTSLAIPYGVLRGDSIAVTAAVKNRGTATAVGGWIVRVYLSQDTSITSGDLLLGAGTVPVSLAAGASVSQTVRVPVAATTPWGMYYVGVILDAADRVAESSETNNILISTMRLGVIPKIDLVVTAVSTPLTILKGTAETMTIAVRNLGAETLAAAIRSDLYLSTNRTFEAGDVAIGSFTVPTGVGPGATVTVSAQVTVPTNVTLPEPWYVIAFVDGGGRMPESEEGNNVTSSTATMTARYPRMVPDLRARPLSAYSGLLRGEGINVTVMVQNQGNGSSTASWRTRYFLSDNATINGASEGMLGGASKDILLAEVTTAAPLAPGAEQGLSQFLTLPTGLASANYYLGVTVDRAGEAPAGSSLHSTRVVAITKPADLVAVGVVGPSAIDARTAFGGTVSFANQGASTIPRGWRWTVRLMEGSTVRYETTPFSYADDLTSGTTGSSSVWMAPVFEMRPGRYRLGLVVDPANTLYEETTSGTDGEVNNIATSAEFMARAVVDLSVSVSQDARTTLVDLLNAGPDATTDISGSGWSGTANLSVTASSDSLGQQVLATWRVPLTLTAGERSRQSFFLSVPSGTRFFLRAQVDYSGQNAVERNLTNNVAVNPQQFTMP